MKKIVTVVGARPQFIKAATVSRALRSQAGCQEVLLHTGQHFDANMSEIFFHELEIPKPDYHLGIHGGGHGEMTGRMLAEIERVLCKEEPDIVLVYGDTNSTLAGALAGVKLQIKVAHVEAGLRSFNRVMPEEINRVLTDHAANLLFSPTRAATENLLREGISSSKIHEVGDVMFDAALFYTEKAEHQSQILARRGLSPREYILATLHRAENTDNPERLRMLLNNLNNAASILPVVLPLHPRTKSAIEQMAAIELSPALRITEPLGYLDMMSLEKNARAIVTDSGGVQKEAYFHRVPCVTMRDETEWVELVKCGWNKVVGIDGALFMKAIQSALNEEQPAWKADLYGSGQSAHLIAQVLLT